MFEFIRTHQKLMQFFLLIFLAPLFVIGGLQIGNFGDTATAVAKVGDKVISQQELDYALREQDPQATATPEAKKELLDQLISERALSYQAAHERLTPNAADIQAFVLRTFPELGDPSLPKEARAERYAAIARNQNTTIEGLEAKIARFLVFQRTAGTIQTTAFAPKAVATRLAEVIDQERDVQQIAFKNADYTSQVKVTDDMLKAYYNKNQAQFQVPEQAQIAYLVLSVDKLAEQISIPDADAETFYKNNQKRFTVDEQRRASHILIKTPKGASDAVKAAAKEKAEKLLAEVRKNPADFAKLAKENSEDIGSATKGGDLDFFAKGAMVKPFQDAVDKLKVGEISDVVQSDFGYHVILLTAIKPAEVKPFAEVKAEIVGELKKQQATKKFSELHDTFSNAVFEQSDSLKPAVDKLADKAQLKIETATSVTRKPDPALAPTVAYNNQKFLTALFADDSIKKKQNTEAIEVAPGTLISGRVTEYKAASQKSFEEVQAIVREAVTQAEARRLAQKAADDKVVALKAKDDASGFGEVQTISRAKQAGFNPAILQSVMKADATTLPAFVEVELPGVGYGVVRINKVGQPTNPDPTRAASIQQQLGRTLAQQEMLAYVEAVKAKAKVKILRPDAINTPTPADGGDGDK
jgi:peptidyl-prolyl cis-trans isomerase D